MAIAGHPVHPMIVGYPIACFMSVCLTDLAFVWLGDSFWAGFSLWLIIAGWVVGLIAALVGLVDFVTLREARKHVSSWSHMLSGLLVLALAAANVRLRWGDPAAGVVPWGLFLTANTAAMVAIAGWLGGTLTFRHGIGLYRDPRDVEVEVERKAEERDAPPKE